MHRRSVIIGAFIAAGAIALTGCAERGSGVSGGGDDAAGDSYTLTIGHSVAATAPVNLGSMRFKELVEEASDGRITVEVYPAEEIGSEPELMEGLSLGNVSIALVATAVAADTCPALGVYALPYILEGENDREQYESLRNLTGSEFNEAIIEECEASSGNLVIDNSWWYGNRNLTTGAREVNVPGDMSGLIIRTPPADLHTMAISAFGAETLPMPFSEVYTALDTGVIDGQENPISTIYQNALYEVQDHLSLTNHMTQNQTLVMNADFFRGLSEEDQDLILSAIDEAGQYQSDLQLTTNEEELELLRESGMVVTEPDLTPFKAAVEERVEQHLAGLDMTRADIVEMQR